MKKRFLSLLMALCLMLSLAPAAFAVDVEDVPVDGQIVADVSETDAADPVEEPEAAPVEETPVEEPVEEPAEDETIVEPWEVTEDSTADVWDGESVEEPTANGNVYTIDSAAKLRGFADMVTNGNSFSGKTIELTTDIDWDNNDFTIIGDADAGATSGCFKGVFNGNEHTIMNARVETTAYNVGLFGYVNGGTIKNLNVVNIDVIATGKGNEPAAGIVIGAIENGVIENVTTDTTSSIRGANRTGGIVGSVREKCTLTDCSNYASVTGTGMYTGGVAGALHDLVWYNVKPSTLTGCYNYGTVNGNTEVGGIAGYSDQATISNCHNSGSITATGNYGCGGIIGFDAYNPRKILYTPSKASTVISCTNSGNITGPRSGGIVGTLGVTPGQSQPSSAKTLTVIQDCTNSGAISGTAGKCGAIFGYQITYAEGDGADAINHLLVKITGCVNESTGTVNGSIPDTLTPSPYLAN